MCMMPAFQSRSRRRHRRRAARCRQVRSLGGVRRVLAVVLLAVATVPAAGDAARVWALSIEQPYAPELPPVSETGAAYLAIANAGEQPDRLLGASSPIAERVEIHAHVHEGGVMRMKKLDGLEVPPGGTVRFEPGGRHLMLIGLERPLEAGGEFRLTLRFRDAGTVELAVPVTARGSKGHGAKRH